MPNSITRVQKIDENRECVLHIKFLSKNGKPRANANQSPCKLPAVTTALLAILFLIFVVWWNPSDTFRSCAKEPGDLLLANENEVLSQVFFELAEYVMQVDNTPRLLDAAVERARSSRAQLFDHRLLLSDRLMKEIIENINFDLKNIFRDETSADRYVLTGAFFSPLRSPRLNFYDSYASFDPESIASWCSDSAGVSAALETKIKNNTLVHVVMDFTSGNKKPGCLALMQPDENRTVLTGNFTVKKRPDVAVAPVEFTKQLNAGRRLYVPFSKLSMSGYVKFLRAVERTPLPPTTIDELKKMNWNDAFQIGKTGERSEPFVFWTDPETRKGHLKDKYAMMNCSDATNNADADYVAIKIPKPKDNVVEPCFVFHAVEYDEPEIAVENVAYVLEN